MDDEGLVRRFRAYQRERNLSAMTVQNCRHLHHRYLRWLADHGLTLGTATRDDVAAFVASRPVAPSTRYSYISRLASLYAWLVDEGHVANDPTSRVARPLLPEQVPRPIGTTDLEVALRTAAPRNRAFLTLAAFAGLRCKEIAGLRVNDLLTESSPPILVVTSPKGRRERVVPIHDNVRVAVRLWGPPRAGFVFPLRGDPSTPIRPHTVSHEGNKHLHESGVSATMHHLRAWFLTSIHNQTKDMRLAQELAGHRSLASTAGYVAVNPFDAYNAVARLGLNGSANNGNGQLPFDLTSL